MGRYQTESVGESTVLVGYLPTGGTVTIVLYDLSDGSLVSLDTPSCSEIGSTGLYRWATTNITTPAIVRTEYVYVMTDATSGEKFLGKFVVGGYIDAITEARLVELAAANIPADTDTLIARLTAVRAGYLDNLSAGAVGLESTNQTILADTNELQTDLTNGGRLDLLIDAIKAVTDNLPDSGSLTTLLGYVDDLETRLTAVRAGYLDNLSAGAVGLESSIQAIKTKTDNLPDDIGNILNRVLGLLQENHYIDSTIFDNDNLVSARIRLYSDSASVGTDSNVIATYTLTAAYSGNNLSTFKVTKD